MTDHAAYWQKKVGSYRDKDWALKPSLFAEAVLAKLGDGGKLLELGAGVGNDGLFFAEHGFDVLQTDLQDFRVPPAKELCFKTHDLSTSLPFSAESFDVVYAHLSLHYFSWQRTEELLSEIHALLRPNGRLALLVNSTDDPESEKGEEVERNFRRINGIEKRFFSIEQINSLTNNRFETILLDSNGETYKDREIGTEHLIRYVGKKK